MIFPLLFFGLVLGSILVTSLFINVAVFLFLGIVIFYLVTLPVEWNASSRALQYLKEKEVLDDKELAGVREVLKAAVLYLYNSRYLSGDAIFKIVGFVSKPLALNTKEEERI